MKKITLFSMALLLTGAATAQETPKVNVLPELKNKAVTLGEEVMNMTQFQAGPNNWYAIYQARPANNAEGGYFWDKGAGERLYKSLGTSVLAKEKTPIADAAPFIVRFQSAGSTDKGDFYTLQFATGNYLGLPGNGANSGIFSAPNIDRADPVRFYVIKQADAVTEEQPNPEPYERDGHWGFNLKSNDMRLNNNGSGNTLSPWESGTITAIGANSDHKIYKVVISDLTELEIAQANARAAYERYLALQDGLKNNANPDGKPGTYNSTLVEAFAAAIEEATNQLESPDAGDMTVEQYNALAKKLKETYDAAAASKVPFAVAVEDGYYFINTNPFFTEVVPATADTEDPETGEVIPGTPESTIKVAKGLFAKKEGQNINAKWGTNDKSAAFLWKITTRGDKVYEMVNMGTDAKLNAVTTSQQVTLSLKSDSLVVFDINENDQVPDGGKNYNIRLAAQKERNYFYLHCGGHGGGKNKQGNIVGWEQSQGLASEWNLVKVTEEEAQQIIAAYAPIKNKEERINSAKTMLRDVEPKLKIARDEKVVLGEKQIKTVDQLSSPDTESPSNEPGSGLEMLLDGKANTFWHSKWSGGKVAMGVHYLQVQLPSDTLANALIQITRRPVDNDHPTSFAVFGTNSADAEKAACDSLTLIHTPYVSNTETVQSEIFNVTKEGKKYQYLRFYVWSTAGNSPNHGYWHTSEFQLYPAKLITNPNNQAKVMGDIYTNMVSAFESTKPHADSITVEQYNQLKAAYDAFIAKYVNPDTLRNKIATAEAISKGIVTGNNPGQWKDANAANGMTGVLEAAKAYDKAGDYTPANSKQQIANLDEAIKSVQKVANQVEEGKWYTFQFPTEKMYDTNGWGKDGAKAIINDEQKQVWPALFGKYVFVAKQNEAGEGVVERNIEHADPAEVTLGQSLFFAEKNGEIDPGMSQFRFIAIGDSAYLIQNKATGLFLRAAGTSGGVTVSLIPSVWNSKAMGYGKVMISGKSFFKGANENHLHAQKIGNQLVTWESTEVGSNTGFLVEEVGAVESNYDNGFHFAMLPGKMYSFCYPVSITATEGELLGVTLKGTEVILEKMADKTAKAGEPFFYINGEASSFNKETTEKDYVKFQHGNELVREPLTVGSHVGVFAETTIGAGNLLPEENTIKVAWKNQNVIPAYGSYVKAELPTDAQLNVHIDDKVFNSIQQTVTKAMKDGNIYTIDGKYVGKGNLSTKLPRGLYIINGVKVVVK